MANVDKSKPLVLSSLETDLLLLLSVEPLTPEATGLYGSEFISAFADASNGERLLTFGSLYPTLLRMEKKKLIRGRWGNETQGPRRKYYIITPKGWICLVKQENLEIDLLNGQPIILKLALIINSRFLTKHRPVFLLRGSNSSLF